MMNILMPVAATKKAGGAMVLLHDFSCANFLSLARLKSGAPICSLHTTDVF
jgi:hypothetical protein